MEMLFSVCYTCTYCDVWLAFNDVLLLMKLLHNLHLHELYNVRLLLPPTVALI